MDTVAAAVVSLFCCGMIIYVWMVLLGRRR